MGFLSEAHDCMMRLHHFSRGVIDAQSWESPWIVVELWLPLVMLYKSNPIKTALLAWETGDYIAKTGEKLSQKKNVKYKMSNTKNKKNK